MRCERCNGSGIFYTGVRNMTPIKAKPDDGMCYRCLGTGIDPYLSEETNNKTTMKEEDGTMMNYKEMKWVEIVAYAKGLGINTGHKKRVEIESDIETYFVNQNVVPVGDMSSDKYYPELQETQQPKEKTKEMNDLETRILQSINSAKYESKYRTGMYLIKTVSLMTCIRKNVEEKYRVDVIIKRIIQKMINKGLLATCSNGNVYRVN